MNGKTETKMMSEMAAEARFDRRKENEFIKNMEPVVKSEAAAFARRSGLDMFLPDLENAARMGIHNAIFSFDFSYKGFFRYLKRAMAIEMRKFATEESRVITLPRNTVEGIAKVRKAERCIRERGDEVTISSLMDESGITSGKSMARFLGAMKTEGVVSLDAPISRGDGDRCVGDSVRGGISAEEEFLTGEERRGLRKAIASLSPQDRLLVMYPFLVEERARTRQDVAMELGLPACRLPSRRRKVLSAISSVLGGASGGMERSV